MRFEDDGATQVCYKYSALQDDPVVGTDQEHTLTFLWEAAEIGRVGANTFVRRARYGRNLALSYPKDIVSLRFLPLRAGAERHSGPVLAHQLGGDVAVPAGARGGQGERAAGAPRPHRHLGSESQWWLYGLSS